MVKRKMKLHLKRLCRILNLQSLITEDIGLEDMVIFHVVKNILLLFSLLVFIFSLSAREIADFDKGFIASVKHDRCFRVTEYPGRDVRPSFLFMDASCLVLSYEEAVESLIVTCRDKSGGTTIFLYTLKTEACDDSLAAAKRRLK